MIPVGPSAWQVILLPRELLLGVHPALRPGESCGRAPGVKRTVAPSSGPVTLPHRED